MIEPIVLFPNPILRVRAERVLAFDGLLDCLATRMLQTMRRHAGLGLAAPQVGRSMRVIVLDREWNCEPLCPEVMVNPVITLVGDEARRLQEGCLSLPGKFVDIRRHAKIDVIWEDLSGTQHQQRFYDMCARTIQHEVDHLNGVLIIDYGSPYARVIKVPA